MFIPNVRPVDVVWEIDNIRPRSHMPAGKNVQFNGEGLSRFWFNPDEPG
jgi:hypothetical protein